MRFRETSESDPLTRCRKVKDDVKTGGFDYSRDKSRGKLRTALGGIRHRGSVNLN